MKPLSSNFQEWKNGTANGKLTGTQFNDSKVEKTEEGEAFPSIKCKMHLC